MLAKAKHVTKGRRNQRKAAKAQKPPADKLGKQRMRNAKAKGATTSRIHPRKAAKAKKQKNATCWRGTGKAEPLKAKKTNSPKTKQKTKSQEAKKKTKNGKKPNTYPPSSFQFFKGGDPLGYLGNRGVLKMVDLFLFG